MDHNRVCLLLLPFSIRAQPRPPRIHGDHQYLTQPKPKDADQLLADGATTFFGNPHAPPLQITFARHPDEITADQRFPIHAIGAIDQALVLPGQSLGTMALAGEDVDRLEIGILATGGWRDDDARVLPMREFANILG